TNEVIDVKSGSYRPSTDSSSDEEIVQIICSPQMKCVATITYKYETVYDILDHKYKAIWIIYSSFGFIWVI
ncbi:15709_t:CDS:1, partial [Cetraspora pellucida]